MALVGARLARADSLPGHVPADSARIALLGNPNTGKTTLFNRLCGARAKTANFPGTTTGLRVGRALVGPNRQAEIVDLPGLYELRLDVPESRLCRDVLNGEGLYATPDAVVVVVDACNLTRNLVLAAEALETERPVVVALNMVDLAQRRGLTIDPARLSARLGCPVVPMIARHGIGVEDIRREVIRALAGVTPAMPETPRPPAGSSLDTLTAWADTVVEQSVAGAAVGAPTDTFTERLDKAFTHPVLGL